MAYEDSDLDAVRERLKQKMLARQLQDSSSPYADLGLKLAGGFTDVLSRDSNASLDPVETATGLSLRRGPATTASSDVQQALSNRDTRARQAALDDMNSIGTIQKMIDAKTEKEKEAKQRGQTLDMGGYAEDPTGKLTRVKGGKADLELRKLQSDIDSNGIDRGLKRQLTQAQINALNTKANPGNKEYKKEQYDAAGFGQRLRQAEDVFSKLEGEGYNRASLGQSFESALPGMMQNEKLRQQEQAERNFVNAVLRRESGAAISPQEFESAKQQYFPRSGDTPDVLAQKKQNRESSIGAIEAAAGGALKQLPQVPLESAYSGPKPGSVEDGHVFLGGDPSDPASWKAI